MNVYTEEMNVLNIKRDNICSPAVGKCYDELQSQEAIFFTPYQIPNLIFHSKP